MNGTSPTKSSQPDSPTSWSRLTDMAKDGKMKPKKAKIDKLENTIPM